MEKDKIRSEEQAKEIEKRAEIQEYRLEQANLRMKKIEEEEEERCRQTAELLKEFEKNSCNGPFFKKLLEILVNYQGRHLEKFLKSLDIIRNIET